MTSAHCDARGVTAHAWPNAEGRAVQAAHQDEVVGDGDIDMVLVRARQAGAVGDEAQHDAAVERGERVAGDADVGREVRLLAWRKT